VCRRPLPGCLGARFIEDGPLRKLIRGAAVGPRLQVGVAAASTRLDFCCEGGVRLGSSKDFWPSGLSRRVRPAQVGTIEVVTGLATARFQATCETQAWQSCASTSETAVPDNT